MAYHVPRKYLVKITRKELFSSPFITCSSLRQTFTYFYGIPAHDPSHLFFKYTPQVYDVIHDKRPPIDSLEPTDNIENPGVETL